MEPKLSNACSQYGASMGRRSYHAGDVEERLKFRVHAVRLDSGGYDNGGAYWGSGTPLYRALAQGETGPVEWFFRAKDRIAAMQHVLATYPNAYFARGTADSLDFCEFLQAYMVAALWSSTDDNGEPLDKGRDISDIAPETRKRMRAECKAFWDANRKTWQAEWTDSDAGHDFWLTRNGHGVGFWDRGKSAGDALTRAAKAAREVYLYVGDDNRVYQG